MNYVPTEVEPITLTLDDCRRFTEIKDQMRRDLTVHIVRRKAFEDPPVPQEKRVRKRIGNKRTLDRETESLKKDRK